MFIVPGTLKWKNNDPRRESAMFSPLAVLVNKVLWGEIHSLPACVLSTAHAALPELSSYNREQCLTKSERVSICFFRVKFAKPRAKSFTWFSGEGGKLREDSAHDSPAIINTSLIFTKQVTWPRVQEIDTVDNILYPASGYIFQHTESAPPIFQNTLA